MIKKKTIYISTIDDVKIISFILFDMNKTKQCVCMILYIY